VRAHAQCNPFAAGRLGKGGSLPAPRGGATLDGTGNVLATSYYRYYTAADAGNVGCVDALKYALGPQSYARAAAAVGDPTTALDAAIAPYADDCFAAPLPLIDSPLQVADGRAGENCHHSGAPHCQIDWGRASAPEGLP
jgi:hypothetical protein